MPQAVSDPIAGFIAFTRALRAAGVTSEGSGDFIEAVNKLDPGDRDDVYWAGRATLCDEPDDIPTYDRVFLSWFASHPSETGPAPTVTSQHMSKTLGGDYSGE